MFVPLRTVWLAYSDAHPPPEVPSQAKLVSAGPTAQRVGGPPPASGRLVPHLPTCGSRARKDIRD